MKTNAYDYLKRWQKKQALRTLQNTNGIFYKIQHNLAGSIKIEATITPEAMTTALAIAESFHLAVIDAITTSQSKQHEEELERIESEQRRIEYNQRKRLALSVYRRTKSRKLAAVFLDDSSNFVKMVVEDANKRQNKAHRSARNASIYKLNKEGSSIRTIAKRYDLHPSTVHSIIKNVTLTIQPVVF